MKKLACILLSGVLISHALFCCIDEKNLKNKKIKDNNNKTAYEKYYAMTDDDNNQNQKNDVMVSGIVLEFENNINTKTRSKLDEINKNFSVNKSLPFGKFPVEFIYFNKEYSFSALYADYCTIEGFKKLSTLNEYAMADVKKYAVKKAKSKKQNKPFMWLTNYVRTKLDQTN